MDIIHKYWKIIIAIGIIACFFFLIVAFSKNLFPEFLPLENISNNMTNISEVAPPAYLSPIIAINSNRNLRISYLTPKKGVRNRWEG